MNLTELLDETARRWPRKLALIEGSTGVSYGELVAQAAAFSSALHTLQLPAGCRIGLYYPNSINYVALTFALWRISAAVVPIPTECTNDEISDMATSMGLEAILSPDSLGHSVRLSPECFFTPLSPTPPLHNHDINIAFIRFTSGTTNARKGVVLSHDTVRDRIVVANKALCIGSEDTVMWCLPMSHHFLITILLYLSQGATIVLARHVLAWPFLEAVNHWGGTVLYAAPFHYALLARDNSGANLSSVRLAVSTTCALPQDVADDFFRRFHLPLAQALGIIELGLVSLNTDDPHRRWNSVGRPLHDLRVRIVAPDSDGCGEVAVAGPGMFDAYAAPWLTREQVAPEGWFATGDIGWLDEDSFLFLAGRKSAVINLAGRKVFPEEIETVINRHPAVRESRVYGRAHPHLGEVVEADVVLVQTDADLETVRDFCRTHLASYKIPSRLHVVSTLPRTVATGKIRRAVAVAKDD
jgi:long-chain acyl-CoA synthetase